MYVRSVLVRDLQVVIAPLISWLLHHNVPGLLDLQAISSFGLWNYWNETSLSGTSQPLIIISCKILLHDWSCSCSLRWFSSHHSSLQRLIHSERNNAQILLELGYSSSNFRFVSVKKSVAAIYFPYFATPMSLMCYFGLKEGQMVQVVRFDILLLCLTWPFCLNLLILEGVNTTNGGRSTKIQGYKNVRQIHANLSSLAANEERFAWVRAKFSGVSLWVVRHHNASSHISNISSERFLHILQFIKCM